MVHFFAVLCQNKNVKSPTLRSVESVNHEGLFYLSLSFRFIFVIVVRVKNKVNVLRVRPDLKVKYRVIV